MRNYTETADFKKQLLERRLATANANDKPKIILAVNLLRLRTEQSKGQTEVAQALGVNQKNYSQWEQADIAPSLRYLIALAKYYGVTVDYLLTPFESTL